MWRPNSERAEKPYECQCGENFDEKDAIMHLHEVHDGLENHLRTTHHVVYAFEWGGNVAVREKNGRMIKGE